jgi:hypothetical protein
METNRRIVGGVAGRSFMYVRVLEQFCDLYASKESGEPGGFHPNKTYRVHKIESFPETGAGYVVLVNDRQELCWVENWHVRVTSEEDFPRARAAEMDLPIRIPQSGPYTA